MPAAKTTTAKIAAQIEALNVHGEREPMRRALGLAKLGKTAFPQLVEALTSHANIRIRRWSAYALGLMKDKRAIPALRRALRDPNMSVRLLAMESLENLAGASAGRHLLPL